MFVESVFRGRTRATSGSSIRELCLYVRGAIDLATTPKVRQDFVDSVMSCRDHVALDCTDMTFIDSAGTCLILEMHAELQAQGRRLRLTRLSPENTRVLSLLGLEGMLLIETAPSDELPMVG